jgi:RimJ/RimL family protein N-acetyltransferase
VVEEWTSCVRTRNDVQICIRPLRPDDREREIAFMNSLSERSRYFRLFTPRKFLPPHLIDQLMDVDYQRRMAFVAVVERNGAEEFVGVARYGEADQPGVAELGVAVTDSSQRCGIAHLLVMQLMRFARCHGICRLTGMVLADNSAMLALAASLGFHASYDSAQHLIVISRDLADIPVERVDGSGVGQTRGACRELGVGAAGAVV